MGQKIELTPAKEPDKMTPSLDYEDTIGTFHKISQECITKVQQTNWIKRVIFGAILITAFTIIILLGPFCIMLLALAIQVLCFNEILFIGYKHNRIPDSVPLYRSLYWYFLVATNYFCLGETFAPHFADVIESNDYLKILVNSHRFISFCLYFVGIIWFVLTLGRKHALKKFRLLAWTHTLLLIIVVQSYMIIETIFQGMIWLLLPASLVILNDIFAYIFGRSLGKTPLIQVSPKKTWEGFIGGGVGTLISGFLLSDFMCRFKYLVCPIEYEYTENGLQLNTDYTPSYLFVRDENGFYPFCYWHFLAFALFASLIAPFGGFCASGFKRAVKIKDFGDAIPGHGGIMDRFDCEFLMATFVNVYIFTFVNSNSSIERIYKKIMYMNEHEQLEFYYLLEDLLKTRKLIYDVS